MWQSHIAGQAVAKPDAGGVGHVGRIEGDGNAIETESRLIYQIGAENVRLAERANLPMRMPMVTPARNGIALECWFCAHILLEGIEAVRRIGRAELLQKIAECTDRSAPGRP